MNIFRNREEIWFRVFFPKMNLFKYFLLLVYVIKSSRGLSENVTYSSIGWPYLFTGIPQLDQHLDQRQDPPQDHSQYRPQDASQDQQNDPPQDQQNDQRPNHQQDQWQDQRHESSERRSSLPMLLSLYKNYQNNFIQIDDDPKYDRENQSPIEEDSSRMDPSNLNTSNVNNTKVESSKDNVNSSTVVNKSESEFRPTIETSIDRPNIDPIVPIIKRMLRRKDIRKEYPNYESIKRRKGSSSGYNDETSRSSSNKVYNDEDDGHSSYGQEDEEEDEPYYEDDNWSKKSLGGYPVGHAHHHSHSSLLPLHDHYYTGSTGVPAYWNHGHYYPYYQPYHGHHHYIGKYGKHLYKEEYAIILVVISLAAFLGLLFSMLMPYALIQSQAITGVPSNTVPYTNAVTSLSGNQFGNTAVSTDVNRIMNPFGRRRRKRMIRFDAMQYLNEQLNGKSDGRSGKRNPVNRNGDGRNSEYVPLSEFLKTLYRGDLMQQVDHRLLEFAARTTYNLLLNNL